jgi:sulfur-carrier protein
MIKIFIPTPLRKFTGDQSMVEVQAATVHDAIEGLARQFPELDQHLFDTDRQVRKFVRIFLGDSDIAQLNGVQTALKAGDEVSIIPAIAGGCSSCKYKITQRYVQYHLLEKGA